MRERGLNIRIALNLGTSTEFLGLKHQSNEMRQLKIVIRKPGQNQERPVVLGRFGSMVITVLLVLAAIVLVTTVIFLGYLAIGLVFAALLIALAVALIRGAFQSFRR